MWIFRLYQKQNAAHSEYLLIINTVSGWQQHYGHGKKETSVVSDTSVGKFLVQLKRIETRWQKNIHRTTLMLNSSQSWLKESFTLHYLKGLSPLHLCCTCTYKILKNLISYYKILFLLLQISWKTVQRRPASVLQAGLSSRGSGSGRAKPLKTNFNATGKRQTDLSAWAFAPKLCVKAQSFLCTTARQGTVSVPLRQARLGGSGEPVCPGTRSLPAAPAAVQRLSEPGAFSWYKTQSSSTESSRVHGLERFMKDTSGELNQKRSSGSQ